MAKNNTKRKGISIFAPNNIFIIPSSCWSSYCIIWEGSIIFVASSVMKDDLFWIGVVIVSGCLIKYLVNNLLNVCAIVSDGLLA